MRDSSTLLFLTTETTVRWSLGYNVEQTINPGRPNTKHQAHFHITFYTGQENFSAGNTNQHWSLFYVANSDNHFSCEERHQISDKIGSGMRDAGSGLNESLDDLSSEWPKCWTVQSLWRLVVTQPCFWRDTVLLLTLCEVNVSHSGAQGVQGQ